jgi:phosphotransferase system enzyme I (PtsP)
MPAVGVMIEVPAAVFQARSFAAKADFLSVGSNDLTQYLLAVDRNNSRVADLYHSFHPAVLTALNDVAKAGVEGGCPVSICGELAGDPLAAPLLLAMDFDVLSMNASSLTRVKKVVRSIRRDSAAGLLKQVLQAEHGAQVQKLCEEFLLDHGLQAFVRSHDL